MCSMLLVSCQVCSDALPNRRGIHRGLALVSHLTNVFVAVMYAKKKKNTIVVCLTCKAPRKTSRTEMYARTFRSLVWKCLYVNSCVRSLCRNAHEVSDHYYIFFSEKSKLSFSTRMNISVKMYIQRCPKQGRFIVTRMIAFCRVVFFPVIVCACEKHYAQSSYRNHVLFLDDFSTEYEEVLCPFGTMPN